MCNNKERNIHSWNPVLGESVIYEDGETGHIVGVRTDKDLNILIRTKAAGSSKTREGVVGKDLTPLVFSVEIKEQNTIQGERDE